jgi:hypothetical protein
MEEAKAQNWAVEPQEEQNKWLMSFNALYTYVGIASGKGPASLASYKMQANGDSNAPSASRCVASSYRQAQFPSETFLNTALRRFHYGKGSYCSFLSYDTV